MGGSLSPNTDNPEFANNPRHEFNFWFDPEAAQVVLRAPWKKIVCTPTDISIKTRLTPAIVKQIEAAEHRWLTICRGLPCILPAPTSCGTNSLLRHGSTRL